jgi:zinc ribbon protein
MSKPEIARRCSACGASIREAAAFCPQCGEELIRHNLTDKPTTSVVTTPLVDFPLAQEEADPKEPRAESDEEKSDPKERTVATPRKPRAGKAPVGKVRDKIQRATTLARDVEGDVLHRVQKVRHISSVVLDEAGYDPSLRFVLVAAALFLLFLLVLLLNKLIG